MIETLLLGAGFAFTGLAGVFVGWWLRSRSYSTAQGRSMAERRWEKRGSIVGTGMQALGMLKEAQAKEAAVRASPEFKALPKEAQEKAIADLNSQRNASIIGVIAENPDLLEFGLKKIGVRL